MDCPYCELTAERDRYKAALERIADEAMYFDDYQRTAREALREGE
jgi:hypothetical protein